MKTTLTLIAAAALLAACAGPEPRRPTAPEAAQAALPAPGFASPGGTGTAAAELPWAQAFRGERLQRLIPLALANNHSGDYGQAAFLETMQHLDSAGIAHFGGGRHLADAHRPLWISQNGMKIAVLSYNEFKPRAFQAGPDWPGVAWSEDDRVVADIQAARRAGADVIIPFMHWGWERERQPTERQRSLARLMIDSGADVVVGGHPHVTQGVETYRGKLIVYSLGNFVFDGFESLATRTGWMLFMTVGREGVRRWHVEPVRTDWEGSPHPLPWRP